MYGICKQIHPPTGIEHSIYCNFYSLKEKNLVVAGATQLSVYRLNTDIEVGLTQMVFMYLDLQYRIWNFQMILTGEPSSKTERNNFDDSLISYKKTHQVLRKSWVLISWWKICSLSSMIM